MVAKYTLAFSTFKRRNSLRLILDAYNVLPLRASTWIMYMPDACIFAIAAAAAAAERSRCRMSKIEPPHRVWTLCFAPSIILLSQAPLTWNNYSCSYK